MVLSVGDNSEAYAGLLVEIAKQMEGNADFWKRLVDGVGVRGRGRGIFCVELEEVLGGFRWCPALPFLLVSWSIKTLSLVR